MECKIELIFVPVTDVDRAIEFYVEKVGFTLDMQARVDENVRFVQSHQRPRPAPSRSVRASRT